MKTVIFFSLTFILCVFQANSAPGPVLDDHGKPLRSGVEYILWPWDSDGFSGSIISGVVGNKTCPAGVIHTRVGGDSYSLTITPVDPKKGVVRLSTDVNIKFSGSSICHESNVWKLEYNKAIKQHVVMLGGVEGNPGPKTLDNWFKIEKTYDSYDNNGYKFVYCPSVCSYCNVTCVDVGTAIHEDTGVARLVLGGNPLLVNFGLP